MMCAKLLPAHEKSEPGRISRALGGFFDALVRGYGGALTIALQHRRITLGIMLATVAATLALFATIPKGFFPQQDTGLIIGISEAAQDVSPEGMKQRQRAILGIISRDPAVADVVGYVGPGGPTVTENNGRVFISLKPGKERDVTADQVITRLTAALQQVEGMKLFMQAAQDITIGGRLSKTQYQFTVTDVDLEQLNFYAPRLLNALEKLPELSTVASDQQSTGRTLMAEIDRAAASRLGIDPATVDATLYNAFGQRHVARIYTALNQYYVILEVDPRYQLGPNALQRIYVRSQNDTSVPLSQIAKLVSGTAPIAVNHQGQFPSVTLSFNLAPGSTIGAAVSAVQKAVADLHMPPSISTSFQGNAQAFQASLSSTPPLILAALLAVYIILGMLYESTIHPLTILSTLPSAGLGALLTLTLFGLPLDLIGIIGVILLIGIVKKNGIMLVDVAMDKERHEGKSAEDAIHEACILRFRPILMTTLSAMLGGVPLMLGTGAGSEIRQPLGYAIVGGLLVSQVLTLFTTPVVYIYMDKLSRSLSGWATSRGVRGLPAAEGSKVTAA
jgi:HAE1 family hydrophobic/amphiphilic exporter-1